MAHTATTAALAGELVTSITGLSATKDAVAFKKSREAAVRAFRTQQYGRTNQFEVQESLDGLVEKFQILYREDLAEALDKRLKGLQPLSTKWTPEMLFLFLELSDRPLEKTDLADLEKLKPPEPPSELTWEDIVRDDPLNEKCIWDDIDYAAHGSSDDDSVFVAEADGSDGDVSTTGDAADGQASSAQDAIIDPDETIIEKMANAQIPLRSLGSRPEDSVDKVESSNITELMVIRETLFMLAGLPILLCEMSQGFSTVRFRETLQLGQSSTNSVSSILKEMAELGTTLNTLRAWALRPQSVALLQVLRNCVEQDLRRFAKTLSDLQSTYISPNENSVVSILHVADRVRSESLLLVKEQAMVEELRDDAPPYQCLELLYDRICLTQLVGDTVLCRRLRDVFFRCFRYYLRPICTWMREGQIDDEYEDMFFVQENERPAGGPSLWHDQFSLRRNLMEEAFAPQFIHGPLKRILNTGKTAVFQRALGFDDSFSTVDDSRDSLIAMWEQPDDALLLPFAEEFAVTFNEWVTSQHTVASVTVKDRLFNDCGLSDCLDALEYLYLSRDGALFQLFADSLFNKLDARMPNWNDDFLLTDRLQTIFEPVPQIETDNINILLDITRVGPRSVKRLGTILIEYELQWPLSDIILPSSLPTTYQKVLILLLQVYRARFLLRKLPFSTFQVTSGKKSAELLRFRLSQFVDVLQDYLTGTVIATSTAQMRTYLANAEDIDAMAAAHQSYTKRLEAQCLLAKNLSPIRSAVIQLLDLAVAFYDAHALLQKASTSEDDAAAAREKKKKKRRRRSALQVTAARDASDSDGDADAEERDSDERGDYDADTEKKAILEGPFPERVRKAWREFEKLNNFIIAGLRQIGRSGGEACWEMLAERLE